MRSYAITASTSPPAASHIFLWALRRETALAGPSAKQNTLQTDLEACHVQCIGTANCNFFCWRSDRAGSNCFTKLRCKSGDNNPNAACYSLVAQPP